MSEKERIEHPSFGLIGFSRASSTPRKSLFGSSIEHRSFVQLEIHSAVLERSSHRDWVFEKKLLFAVNLSTTQFAEAITSMNRSGIPCTISFMDGHRVKETEVKSKRLQYDEDFEKYATKIASENNEFIINIGEILSKKHIGKRDRAEILKQLDMLQMQIISNIPFLKKEFTAQMEKTVLEAKNDFEALVDDKLRSVGLLKFKEELLALVGKPIQE